MEFQQSVQLLQDLQFGGQIRHEKTLISSVTTDWRVRWDEDFIARDLLQNFYDANRDHVESIRISADGQRVTISAPTGCNLERLFTLEAKNRRAMWASMEKASRLRQLACCALSCDAGGTVGQPNRRTEHRRRSSS